MIELVCYMATCVVMNHAIFTCNAPKVGTKADIQKMALELHGAGEVMVSECTPPNVAPSLTWFRKEEK